MKVNCEEESLNERIREAMVELRLARQDERLADSDHIELAIERVIIAQSKINSLYKQAKLLV